MTSIVNQGKPVLKVQKRLTATISCPNCNDLMTMDSNDIDIGNTIKCSNCKNKTYYPFNKPWHRKTKLIVTYLLSVIIALVIGNTTNIAFDKYKELDQPNIKVTPGNMRK
jgi:uncharacterized paraquat-inducible protein A